MSKRKHKDGRDTNCMNTTNNRNNANVNNMNNNRATYNNGPFGINPNQLLSSMFGNIDMNQINSLLQSMSTQGFDFNNLNLTFEFKKWQIELKTVDGDILLKIKYIQIFT